MQFNIALGSMSSVEPSGRSSTARRCCSNWLVRAPTIELLAERLALLRPMIESAP